MPINLTKKLLKWYKNTARDLPWRETKDPYRIWLSEVILQQTKVAQGLPYYLNFLKNFPSLKSLSEGPESEVLRSWQGLGYYSRARNLHRAAKIIYHDLEGIFPSSFETLIQLPGVGPYTAAAVASIAYNQPVAAIDGNALRVYSRYWGVYDDIAVSKTAKKIRELAQSIIPHDDPGAFNQAIMELGSRLCAPQNPLCSECPVNAGCFAFIEGEQKNLPVKFKNTKVKNRYFNYFIFRRDDRIAMFQRREQDIWQGLYDFYLLERKKLLELDEISDPVVDYFRINGGKIGQIIPMKKHVLSHRVIHSRFFEIIVPTQLLREDLPNLPSMKFYSKNDIQNLPKPVLVNNFLNYYFSESYNHTFV